MAKRTRKSTARRAAPRQPEPGQKPGSAPEAVPPAVSLAEDLQTPVSRSGRAGTSSPLARSQEIELEVGVTLIGTAVGALTGFSEVPFGVTTGNVTAACELGVLGATLGFCIGRSLFLSMRAQWFVWAVIALLTWGGSVVAGAPGELVGAALATAFLLFGLRPLALAAARAGASASPPGPSSEGAPEPSHEEASQLSEP